MSFENYALRAKSEHMSLPGPRGVWTQELEMARRGQEVCVKIASVPGEAPKTFGRHFDETDFLVSKINRASIDACKNHFRDDLQKDDLKLMIELEGTFGIM